MRRGTLLLLLTLVVLAAFFGLLKAIGILVAAFVTILLLFLAALFVGAWLLKRRMRRKLAELQGAIQEAARQEQERRRSHQVRRDAIEADFEPGGRDDPR